jgi:hypothetical protein
VDAGLVERAQRALDTLSPDQGMEVTELTTGCGKQLQVGTAGIPEHAPRDQLDQGSGPPLHAESNGSLGLVERDGPGQASGESKQPERLARPGAHEPRISNGRTSRPLPHAGHSWRSNGARIAWIGLEVKIGATDHPQEDSISKSRGREMTPRARATICCSPPEREDRLVRLGGVVHNRYS